MSIDLKLCSKVLSMEDLDSILTSGLTVQDLKGKGREAYEFIMNYRRSYEQFPDPKTVEDEMGVELEETDDSFEYLVDEIKNRKGRNMLARGAQNILDEAEKDNISSGVQELKKTLSQLHEEDISQGGNVIDFGETIERRIDYYKDLKMRTGPEGICTPWNTMNTYTEAWRDGNTHLIVGRSGVGKTWTFLRSALESYYNGKKTLVVTTEMTEKEIGKRVDAIHAGIPYNDLKEGELDFGQEEKLQEKMHEFQENKGFILVPDGFASTTMDIDMLISEYNPDIVFIDGIYLIEPTVDYGNLTEQLNKTSSQLKLTALRQDIPIVSTHQLNRSGSSENISLRNLAYSDKLGWDASIVMALFQDEDMEDRKEMKSFIIKSRDGQEGSFLMRWDFQTMDFSEIEDQKQEPEGTSPDDEDKVGGQVDTNKEIKKNDSNNSEEDDAEEDDYSDFDHEVNY